MLVGLLSSQAFSAQAVQNSQPPAGTDFIEYWSAGRLLLAGGNPYSPAELADVQASVSARAAAPLIMWNPPWTLALILPFAVLSFTAGQFLWLLLNLFLLLWCAQHLWLLYAGTAAKAYLPWLLALTFIPASFALLLGQISPLILFGLTAFLYCEKKQNHFAAGAFSVLVAIKPQLCYLFWLSLVLWILRERQWRLFLGAAIAGLTIAAIPAVFNQAIIPRILDCIASTKWQHRWIGRRPL